MIPPCSCATPGRKPGVSAKVTRGILKASQKRMNRAPFVGRVYVQDARQGQRLLGDNAHRMSPQPSETDDEVGGE